MKIVSYSKMTKTITVLENIILLTNPPQDSYETFTVILENIPEDFGTVNKPLNLWDYKNGKLTFDNSTYVKDKKNKKDKEDKIKNTNIWKNELIKLDYKRNQFIDGELTSEEYETHKSRAIELRKKVLENEII